MLRFWPGRCDKRPPQNPTEWAQHLRLPPPPKL